MKWIIGWLCSAALSSAAVQLGALPEHLRTDPYGVVLRADGGGRTSSTLSLTAARGAYVSCQLVVNLPEGGAYELKLEPPQGIQVDAFREWFHMVTAGKSYYPDALIPVRLPYRAQLPAQDNRITGQTAQAFWLDFWIPLTASPGVYHAKATVTSGGQSATVPLDLTVLAATVPAEDAVTMDHNSYGTSWLEDQYPELRRQLGAGFFGSDQFYGLIHATHRVFYEHRGVYHQLGYGHGGKVGPEFAPRLEGTGRSKTVADWTTYDRHFGPLFDGSAFAGTRRGPRPIPFVYLPINPEWPASYLWWGEPGYEAEFVNVVSEMERHFRQKGWTNTRFELFFNHKKRYKGFSWDGDELRFEHDIPFILEYDRLMKKAVPTDTPVRFVYRADASWMMEQEFKSLAGVINFWVCGGGMFGWYPDAPKLLKDRGDIVWIYGGTPVLSDPASHITVNVLRPWLWGVDGYVHWLSVAPGSDPWFAYDGGGTALVYPGGRFGENAPIPSIRLKIERNAVQDVTLLNSFRNRRTLDVLREGAAKSFNGTAVKDWWQGRPALAGGKPEDWSNTDIDAAIPKDPRFAEKLDSAAWQRVRDYVHRVAKELQ